MLRVSHLASDRHRALYSSFLLTSVCWIKSFAEFYECLSREQDRVDPYNIWMISWRDWTSAVSVPCLSLAYCLFSYLEFTNYTSV